MLVSPTAPGCPGTRADAPGHVAFRIANGVGTRDFCTFTAQWLGYAVPCRRLAAVLASDYARLGANVECYSFTVMPHLKRQDTAYRHAVRFKTPGARRPRAVDLRSVSG
jgi:hypothetical protein